MTKIKGIFMFIIVICMMGSLNIVSAADDVNDFSSIKISMLNQDPDPAEPGKYMEVRFQIQKYGNKEIKDLTFRLDPEFPFYFDGIENNEKVIGDFIGYSDDNSYYILYYRLRVNDDAIEDTYTLKLKYRFNNEEIWNEEDFDVRVGNKEDPEFVLGSVSTSPAKLIGDLEEAEIKLNIENIGDGKADNVKAEFILPEGFEPSYSFSNIVTLGSIDKGMGKEAKFYVDIEEDVNGGIHQGKIKINYKESNDEDNEYKTLILPFDVQVKNRAVFEVEEIKTNPEVLIPGVDADIHIKIKNIGQSDAESVSIRAFKESSQPFDFEDKSDYIGKIKAGESADTTLKLKVEDDADIKEYILDLEIRSIDGDMVVLQQRTMKLDVKGDEGFSFGNKNAFMAFVVVVILAVIGLVVVYFFFSSKDTNSKKK